MISNILYSTPVLSISRNPTVILPAVAIHPSIHPSYLDLNKDEKIRNRLTKYYLYKTLDKWLWSDMKDIIDNFVLKDNIVNIVKTPVKQNLTEPEIEKKIDYIENNILNYKKMYKILKHLIHKEENLSWVSLPKNEYIIKKTVKKYLLKKINHKFNPSPPK